MPRFYPPLAEKDLRLISQLVQADPEYLTGKECPYSKDVIHLLMRGLGQSGAREEATTSESYSTSELTTDAEISNEINNLYHRLQDYWQEVKNSDKSTDKNTFFRVSTSLLEKIVELREKMSNVGQVNSFISTILSIMDELLTPDQRSEVEERLRQFDLSLGGDK